MRDLYYQLKPKSVLDIFAGSGTSGDFFSGLRESKHIKVSYTGLDLMNGFDVLTDPIEGQYDLILAHFPYFNIIRYSRHTSDLSNTDDYSHFLSNVRMVMKKIHSALTDDGTIAVVIGDVRKQGEYYPIFKDIININIGVLRSVIIKKQNHCMSTGKTYRKSKYLIPIAHEYVLLFSKR